MTQPGAVKPQSVYEQYMAEFRRQDAAVREYCEVWRLMMQFQVKAPK